uniref:Uncharacterized protein n=1 Tax=Physcomitrium patens TaxID=3218 RepID=A0A7I4C9K8_PHYPA
MRLGKDAVRPVEGSKLCCGICFQRNIRNKREPRGDLPVGQPWLFDGQCPRQLPLVNKKKGTKLMAYSTTRQ